MLKKRYIIITLGIVSVLLGSLLYSQLVLAGELTPSGKPSPVTYARSVRIEVLHWTDDIYLFADFTCSLPFSFNPEQPFQEVTDLWIAIIVESSMTTNWNHMFNITLNEEIELSSGLHLLPLHSFPLTVSLHVTDPTVLQTLHQGINTIEISDPYRQSLSNPSVMEPYAMFIREIAVFIEYEYQA